MLVMKFDDLAIDTIFGVMIMIISCFACSGIVMYFSDTQHSEPAGTTQGFSERLDLCLLSTVSVDRKVMNTTVRENLQLLDYLALKHRSIGESTNATLEIEARNQIEELFTFYFYWSDWWQLSMSADGDSEFIIAESGHRTAKSNIMTLERAIQISNGTSFTITFSVGF